MFSKISGACRLEANGKEEIEKEREGVAELARQIAGINREAAEKEAEVAELQAQKERQSGRQIKEIADAADSLSKKCAPPSSWSLRPHKCKLSYRLTVFLSYTCRA